eukprot:gene8693-7982_t
MLVDEEKQSSTRKNGDFSDLTTFLTFYCSGTLPE